MKSERRSIGGELRHKNSDLRRTEGKRIARLEKVVLNKRSEGGREGLDQRELGRRQRISKPAH